MWFIKGVMIKNYKIFGYIDQASKNSLKIIGLCVETDFKNTVHFFNPILLSKLYTILSK